MALADDRGWDAVRMQDLAAEMKLPLAKILVHYRDMDAIADAWFSEALAAMVAPLEKGVASLPAKDRLFVVVTRWLDHLAQHKDVSAGMVATKLYPVHVHHWVPMVFNLSRLVHWMLDAAGISSHGRQRQAEEIGLTVITLATLRCWCADDSEDQENTRAFLRRQLARGDGFMARAFKTKTNPEE